MRHSVRQRRSDLRFEVIALENATSPDGRQLLALQFLLAGAPGTPPPQPGWFGGILKHLHGRSQAAVQKNKKRAGDRASTPLLIAGKWLTDHRIIVLQRPDDQGFVTPIRNVM